MWYPWLAGQLRALGMEVDLQAFPDPLYARESIWVPFAVDTLGLNESTVLVGHSSGAACALRLMEKYKVRGCVLVSAYHTDLGDDLERASGYFSRPFDWVAMRRNCPWIVQFHSKNDHLVPVKVARDVAQLLQPTEYVERDRDGHFQGEEYPCFVEVLRRYL